MPPDRAVPAAASPPRPRAARQALFGPITVALAVLAVLLSGELAARLLPVHEPLLRAAFDADRPVARYEPDRSVLYSHGPFFDIVNRVRINREGFVNEQEYERNDPRPLLAVVGDSFVEGLQVPWRDSFHGRLAAELGPARRVYSFGLSGAPISQYLAHAAWVAETFAPTWLVVSVIANDFDESLSGPTSRSGFHYFADAATGRPVLRPFERPLWRRLLLESRLACYLLNNLQVLEWRHRLARAEVAAVGRRSDPARLAELERVADLLVERLAEAARLPPERILILLDADRPAVYGRSDGPLTSTPDFPYLARHLAERARAAGYRVSNLGPVFATAFRRHGRRLEFPTDGHWNAEGHELVARAVLEAVGEPWFARPDRPPNPRARPLAATGTSSASKGTRKRTRVKKTA
jgi:hypothetical protein